MKRFNLFCSSQPVGGGGALSQPSFIESLSKNHVAVRRAFTLAEVLITLGIIGVVAAITMPTLIADYQKQLLVNQLKKSYSTWAQTFQKVLADEGVERLSDTQLWGEISGGCASSEDISDCGNFFSDLRKYINIENPVREKNEYKGGPGSKVYVIKTSDGTLIRYFNFKQTPYAKDTETCNKIKALGGNMYSEIGFILIDVNGYKKPNAYGRDIFEFPISDDGKLYPYGGKDYALFHDQTELSSNRGYWKSDNSYNSCNGDGSIGDRNCTGRIMEEGWKMNY